jgi:hypothetical protein
MWRHRGASQSNFRTILRLHYELHFHINLVLIIILFPDCFGYFRPQPEVLSSGDFLFIYNIDTHIGIKDRNPLGRCTIGWAILDGANPSIILARSSTALVTPTLPWETTECAGAEDTCQTPFVIFADGLKPLGNDEFMVIYGGGDSVGGAIKIKVDVKRF